MAFENCGEIVPGSERAYRLMLNHWPDLEQTRPQLMAGDGSDRRYFRLQSSERRVVLMELGELDQQKMRDNNLDWEAIALRLAAAGVRVPHIHARMAECGVLVIEDCGDNLFQQQVMSKLQSHDRRGVVASYRAAFAVITSFLKLQADVRDQWPQRKFDEKKLRYEMDFLHRHLLEKIPLSQGEQARFMDEVTSLVGFLIPFQRYPVHRDFHSKNLMLKGEELVVIDFQDLMMGSASYDLVSLCLDSYVPLPLALRKTLIENGLRYIERHTRISAKELRSSWRAVALQRQLKAMGSFAYLELEKKRGPYLAHLPSALETMGLIQDPRWPFLSKVLPRIIATWARSS